ncbi:MAG: NAD(P)/FAD-dependent oxidoreductase [Erysipelotrichaceae bacterium]|nr:NAD(P)/FAD-dependent oxidoreductase [Erysipelotrichaceae bacterium]
MNKKKVVIIGAGPAGLAAAYELNKTHQYDITILEAEDVVGGISRTVNYKNNRMDLGGHRFFSKNDRVNHLWHEIMSGQSAPALDDKLLERKIDLDKDGLDPETNDNVILKRHRISRIYFLKKFFDYPISMKPRTFINMGFSRTMKAGFGYMYSSIHKRKEESLEDFYINRFGKPLYQLFFESYTEKLWGVHPSKLSADWGAQRVKGLSLWKAFTSAITKPFKKNKNKVETSLIEQFEYPKYGPGQLYTLMADNLQKDGVKIYFNNEVNKIELKDHKITKVITKDNKEYEADYLISSMPIKDLFTSLDKDKVSEESYQIATTLPYRDFITVGLLLDKLAIKNKTKIKTLNDLVPDTWIYIQERDVKMGRIQLFNNWSPYMVNDPLHTVWIGLEYFASEGDELWEKDNQSFIDMAVSELIKMGIISSKDNVLDAHRLKVKKAYPAYFGSYDHFDKVREELDKIDNLYCIGRNGQHRYNNMDHSMLTGMIAADYIANNNKDKTALWNVNAEKEYHESK